MADVKRIPFFRHLRSDTSSHVLHFRRGKMVRSGRGLAFWFSPMSASVLEVPVDDREIPFFFHGRSADFQDATAQGVITYRVTSPETLADRVDFSIDLDEGTYRKEPLEQLAQMIVQLAQQLAMAFISTTDLRTILSEGAAILRERIAKGLNGDDGVESAGIEIVSVRIAAIKPTAELERALQTPTLEAIQQHADRATFERRAQAVEEERAIRENELQNQIELAKREELLIEQRGANARREATEEVESNRITAEGDAARKRVDATARADSIRMVESARVEAEKARVEIYETLPSNVLMGLAAQELAGKLKSIDHLNITPDMFGSLLTDLASAATTKLKS